MKFTSKKITGLQKQRENKQLLMSELESLEDKLQLLSKKAERTRTKTYSKRQNTQNLNSILDRWKDVNATTELPPPEPQSPPPENINVYEDTPEQISNTEPAIQMSVNLLPICDSLEKSVLKQMKMCINYILQHTAKVDPMLMSLISGTNETVDDYEKLYTQLKLMVFMEKMNQGPARNDLMAFVLSSL